MWEWLHRIASTIEVAGALVSCSAAVAGIGMFSTLLRPVVWIPISAALAGAATVRIIRWFYEKRQQPAETVSASADYLEACDIVERYIHSATDAKRDIVKLTIRRAFIERFEQTTGAMLGPGQYNRALLHQWMQSNAARFLVDHRGEMS